MKKNGTVGYIILFVCAILLIIIMGSRFIKGDNQKKSYFGYSNDIQIRYAYGLGITTIEQRNSKEPYLDIVTIKPEKEELKKLKKAIRSTSFILDKSTDSTGVAGEYELTIGKEVLFFDQEEGIYTKDNKTFYKIEIPTELFDTVSDIVFNNVNKTQEKIKTNTLSISNSEIGNATFTDKKEVQEIINTFRFVRLKSNTDDLTEPEFVIDFNNGITITTYTNSNIGVYTNTKTNEVVYIYLYSNPSEYLRNYLQDKVTLDEGMKSTTQE